MSYISIFRIIILRHRYLFILQSRDSLFPFVATSKEGKYADETRVLHFIPFTPKKKDQTVHSMNKSVVMYAYSRELFQLYLH